MSSIPKIDLEIEGKVAIVTGGGSGINLAFVTLLLSKGCNVVIADISLLPEADALILSYSNNDNNDNNSTPQCLYHRTDVTSWQDLTHLFTFTLTHFATIDILVPGAGIFEPLTSNFYHPPGTPLSNDTLENSSYHTLNVNITHPIRLTQMGVQYWVSNKRGGRVVCVSSIAGQIGVMETPLYNASKFAVTGFVRSVRGLEGLGIRIVGVAPGPVQTPIWSSNPEKEQMLTAEQKWIEKEMVAGAMLDLLTKEEYVGGTILEVSGSGLRVVQEIGDAGPSFPEGYMIGNLEGYKEEIYKGLREGRMGA